MPSTPQPESDAIERRRRWVAQQGRHRQWRRGSVHPTASRSLLSATSSQAGAVQRQRGSPLLHRLGDFSSHAAAGLLAAGAVLAWSGVGLATGFPGWWQTVLYSVSSSITLVRASRFSTLKPDSSRGRNASSTSCCGPSP